MNWMDFLSKNFLILSLSTLIFLSLPLKSFSTEVSEFDKLLDKLPPEILQNQAISLNKNDIKIDRYKNYSIATKKLLQQDQTRVHHAKPAVMPI